jgi:hypothetical protein
MITIKLPILLSKEDQEYISDLQKQQSCVIRSSYSQNLSEKELRSYFKSFTNLNNLDSWFIQSGIKYGLGQKKADKELDVKSRIFGSKANFINRLKNKISRDEYRSRRLMPLYVVGEANQEGNRKFDFFHIIESNKIVFKPKSGIKIDLLLPNLRKNIKRQLHFIEMLTNDDVLPITISLTSTHIYISYEENLIPKQEKYVGTRNKILGIDLNPNYIGTSIQDKSGKVIDTKMWNLKDLTSKSGESSDHKNSKYLSNKLLHETREIAKEVINFAKSHHVGLIAIEKLSFNQGDKNLSTNFNRLTNNVWKRTKFTRLLKKYAKILNIKIVEVNAAYSSTIGNLLNNTYPDPIASSIEIGRRGNTWTFYPKLISKTDLSNQWKEAKDWIYENWIELHGLIKKSGLKYRIPISKEIVFKQTCYTSYVSTCKL